MKKNIKILVLTLMFALCWQVSYANNRDLNNDTINITCYGDSVTFGELGYGRCDNPYPSVLENILRSAYNNNKINVTNKGVCGMRTVEALNNFESVLADNTDVLILMFGINDASGIVAEPISIETYKENITQMVRKAQQKNIEVILLTPTPTSTYYYTMDANKRICEFGKAVIEVAKENNIKSVDMYAKINEVYQKRIYSNFGLQGYDYVHFTQLGYEVIANIVANYALNTDNNIYQINNESLVSVPIVRSIYMQTDFSGVNNNNSQYFYRNYFVLKNGSFGSYLNFPFYSNSEGVRLYLVCPKTYAGGELDVYDNGTLVKKINFYDDGLVYDQKILLSDNLSFGYHRFEFKIENLKKGQSSLNEPLMYFTEFQFISDNN